MSASSALAGRILFKFTSKKINCCAPLQDTAGRTRQGADDTYGAGDGSGYGAASAGVSAGMGAGGYGGGDDQQQVCCMKASHHACLCAAPAASDYPWQAQLCLPVGIALQSHALRSAQALSSLSAGDTLSPGQTLASPNGQSKLVFQDDGNIVVRTERKLS